MPVVFPYVPPAQAIHVLKPSRGAKYPAKQRLQFIAPSSTEIVPTLQLVQDEALSGEKVPGWQISQNGEPMSGAK